MNMEQIKHTLKEDYKTTAQELYDLCDYMYKKAMVLKVLNTVLTDTEVSMMGIAKNTKIMAKDIIDKINNDEQHFDQYDLDYEIYQTFCRQCRSDLKVIEFAKNELDHDFNVYKCVNCGAETQDELPNRIEHVKIYFDYQYQIYDLAFNDKAISKKSKQILREEYNLLKAKEKGCIESNDAVLNAREESRKAIYESIAAYKGMYEELLLSKHMFDRDISEA